MGDFFRQKPVKLIVSIIYSDPDLCDESERVLLETYGAEEKSSCCLDFDYTKYYEEEMGKNLKRKLISYKTLIDKEDAAGIKHESNRIEGLFKIDKKRQVNIDPGYVTEAKLVLLTTKDYTHRVYVGNRIFAESTLYFKNGTFTAWPWTYPDYASDEMIRYFNEIRQIYMEDLYRMDMRRF